MCLSTIHLTVKNVMVDAALLRSDHLDYSFLLDFDDMSKAEASSLFPDLKDGHIGFQEAGHILVNVVSN